MEKTNSEIIRQLSEYKENIDSLNRNVKLIESSSSEPYVEKVKKEIQYHIDNYDRLMRLAVEKGIISE